MPTDLPRWALAGVESPATGRRATVHGFRRDIHSRTRARPRVTRRQYRRGMLRLHHDPPSASSLLAVLLLQDLADEGADVTFHGVDVLGLGTSIPATLDDIAEWQRHREALAERGWDVARPRLHPATLASHVVEALATQRGLGAAWRLSCLRAHWQDGRDLGDHDVLVDIGASIGLARDDVGDLVADRRTAIVARQAAIARRGEGVGGVPVLEAHGTLVSPFLPLDDLRQLAGA